MYNWVKVVKMRPARRFGKFSQGAGVNCSRRQGRDVVSNTTENDVATLPKAEAADLAKYASRRRMRRRKICSV